MQTGIKIVRRALEEPLRRIAENAGLDGAVVVGKVEELKGNKGFNAATGEYEDLAAAGIIDPTKVVRTALQNAASIAGLLLTTDAAVTDAPEPKKGRAANAGRRRGLRLLKSGTAFAPVITSLVRVATRMVGTWTCPDACSSVTVAEDLQ